MGMLSGYTNEAITIVGRGTLGGDGEYDKTGTSTATTAFVKNRRGIVRNRDGEDVVFDKELWLDSSETVQLDDKLTHDSIDHEVIALRDGKDMYGNADFIKVFVRVR